MRSGVRFLGTVFLIFLGTTLLLLFPPFLTDPAVVLNPRYSCQTEHVTQCVFHDICLSEEYGLFYLGENPSSLEGVPWPPECPAPGVSDAWSYNITPVLVHPRESRNLLMEYQHDTALVVAGSFSLFHLSHEVINNLVPIQELLLAHNLAHSEMKLHLLTVAKFPINSEAVYRFPVAEVLGFERLFASGYLAGTASDDPVNQVLPVLDSVTLTPGVLRDKTLCYPKAVIGLNETCSTCDVRPSKEALDLLRLKTLKYYGVPENPIAGRVLVLRRMDSRLFVNHDDLVGLLTEMGLDFEVIIPERKTFAEQVKAFAAASIFIAPHGNGNAHIHWMKEGTVFIEGFNWDHFGSAFFSTVAKQKGLRYFPLPCEDECKQLNTGNRKGDNIFVNTSLVKHLLSQVRRQS